MINSCATVKNQLFAPRISYPINHWLLWFWAVRLLSTVTLSAGLGRLWHGGAVSECFRSLRNATNNSATIRSWSVVFPSAILALTPVRPTTATAVLLPTRSFFKLSAQSIRLMPMRLNSAAIFFLRRNPIRVSYLLLQLLLLLLLSGLGQLRHKLITRCLHSDLTWVTY